MRYRSLLVNNPLAIASIIILSSVRSQGLLRSLVGASFLGRAQAQGYPLHHCSARLLLASHKRSAAMSAHTGSGSSTQSLHDFLQSGKENPSKHYVVGNEAGDADSIVSAIALAYVESIDSSATTTKTPLISIPRADLQSQRPETTLLLRLAGVSHAVEHLIFVDDPVIANDNDPDQVTLVDHNRLKDAFQEKQWKVVEIIDHHHDEGYHIDTCSGDEREIAFGDDKALVASTCTLIVERLEQTWKPPYPVSLGVLLLGVILLDSVNMLSTAGKGTARDGAAIQVLLDHTKWSDLSTDAAATLQVSASTGGKPDTQAFFDALQDAKFDPQFWKGLSVRDALRLDYKRFAATNAESFGVATVLLPLADFCAKPDLVQGLKEYMHEADVRFLGVMLTFEDESGNLCRQLALCGTSAFPLDNMIDFLATEGTLTLEETSNTACETEDDSDLTIRYFNQGNSKASRKQVAPVLLQFFDNASADTESKL